MIRHEDGKQASRREKAGEIVGSMFPSPRTYLRVSSPNGRPRSPFVAAPRLGGLVTKGRIDMRRKEADDYARLGPKRDGKYTVVMGGKVRGRHRTRDEAVAQVQAINLSKLRAEGRRDVPSEPKAAAEGSYVAKDAPQMEIWEGIRTR